MSCLCRGAAVQVAANTRVVFAGSPCPLLLGSDWACCDAVACPGTAPPGWQTLCGPSHLSSLHPRRARRCRMEVRLLFALGREASIVFRGGGRPQPAWCRGQGASREPGPLSAQAVPRAGAWLGPRSARLSPLPGTRHTPLIPPARPRCACPSLLAAQLAPFGAGG